MCWNITFIIYSTRFVSLIFLIIENLLKVTYTLLFFIILFPYLGRYSLFEGLYYVGLSVVVANEELAPLIAYSGMDGGIFTKYEFLPLMEISVACAVGIVWGWMRFLRVLIME
jgi:hypothetical protein